MLVGWRRLLAPLLRRQTSRPRKLWQSNPRDRPLTAGVLACAPPERITLRMLGVELRRRRCGLIARHASSVVGSPYPAFGRAPDQEQRDAHAAAPTRPRPLL